MERRVQSGMVKIGSKEYAVIVTWLSSIQTKVELCDGEEVFSSTCDASSHQPQSRRSSESAETFLISVMEALCHCKMEKYELTLSPSSTSNASSNSDNDVATTLTILELAESSMKLLLVRLDLTPSRNRSHILSMFRAANASMLHLQDLLQEANKHSEVLRSQVADYASHLQQAAQRADEVESGLLTKFRLLLNAKKDKIRELIEAQKKLEEVIANYDTKKHIVEKEEAAPVVRASKRKAVSKVEAFPVKKELKSPSKREGRASQLSQVLHADTASYVYSGDTDALLLKEGTDATAANVASSQQSTSIQPMNVEESALPEEEVDKVPEVDKPRATSSQRIKTRFLDDSDDSD